MVAAKVQGGIFSCLLGQHSERERLKAAFLGLPSSLCYYKILDLTYSHTLKGGDSHPFPNRKSNCAINKVSIPKSDLQLLLQGWTPHPIDINSRIAVSI